MSGSGALAPFAIAVDGGGSKTDAVLLARDGTLLAHDRGPGSSPQVEGLESSVRTVDAVIRSVLGTRALNDLARVHLYLSGLDFAAEIADYRSGIARLPWATENTVVDNDLLALLRSGTDSPDAVAIVCGTGINAIGVRSDGATARFPAIGAISGDWGGGGSLGSAALWHAARADDGRGPETLLLEMVRQAFGVAELPTAIEDLHFGRRAHAEVTALSPVVFSAATEGDTVAIGVVERQAREIVDYARVCLNRLGLNDAAVPIVVGGGVARARHPLLVAGIQDGLADVAPQAELVIIDSAPILGAGLLALADSGADTDALAKARIALAAV
ncbi:MAG: N-acetylglucosamine kinase [Microbacterium sp.]|uniref:N-acetylglucosamine kinase n=1 Tax=Microbacterium sp. TaxID=51671 RepID=UPI003F9BEC6E